MLENLYTTKMSNDKEKLKTRLENIQRPPKKKHTVVGLLVTLALAAALTVGTICLAAANQDAAPDVTMTDEEYTAFLEQPWGAVMATLDYADEESLVFHYNEALCVVDLTNQVSFRCIFDLSGLNLTTATQGDVFLQVDVARDGSEAYLSVGGMTDQAAEYDTYVVDLTSGQVTKEEIPEGADLFRGQKDTFAVIPDVAGWASQCITVGDRTYYLNNGGPMVSQLQLVTHYADSRPDSVWYLFGAPPVQPQEPVAEESSGEAGESREPLAPTVDNTPSYIGSNSSVGDTGDATPSDPPTQQTTHFNDLLFKTANYVTGEFSRAYSSDFRILEESVSDWEYTGENEGTFLYTVTYSEEEQERLQMTFPMKVSQEEDGQLTLYQDTGTGWTPTDVESIVTLP